MKRLIIMALSAAALFSCASPKTEEGLYQNNRSPLVHKPYMELPLGAVKPDGWLRDQLLRQASGMTGHLDQIVPNIMGDRNGWVKYHKLVQGYYNGFVKELSRFINNILMPHTLSYEKWVDIRSQLETIIGHEVEIKESILNLWEEKRKKEQAQNMK